VRCGASSGGKYVGICNRAISSEAFSLLGPESRQELSPQRDDEIEMSTKLLQYRGWRAPVLPFCGRLK
jgi:hypothetical protein